MSPQSATALQPIKGSALPVKHAGLTNVFDRMEELHNAIARRAFELFEGNGQWPGRDLDDWLRAESEFIQPMHLELTELDNHLNVRAEVPGFSAKELEINVEPRRLTVSGKHETKEESKKGRTVYSELCAGEILRVVDLPSEIDTSNVSATLKDGILNVRLPKSPAPKSVRIEPRAV